MLSISPFTLPYHRLPLHRSQGREILAGQLIHVSVCLMGDHYRPKASGNGIQWDEIIGIGINHEKEAGWMPKELEARFEMDLYDAAGATNIVENRIADPIAEEWVGRLEFLASIGMLVRRLSEHGVV